MSKPQNIEVQGAAVLSHPGREKYSQLRAEGFKGAKAAKLCRVSKNTAYRWDADGQVKARIAFLTGQSLREKRGASKSGVRPITFDRNDLIMELWEIGTKGDSDRARVSALLGLCDIFLLRAKCIDDLRKGVGWTEDETIEFQRTRIVPDRIFALTGARTADDLISPPSLRGKKTEGGGK